MLIDKSFLAYQTFTASASTSQGTCSPGVTIVRDHQWVADNITQGNCIHRHSYSRRGIPSYTSPLALSYTLRCQLHFHYTPKRDSRHKIVVHAVFVFVTTWVWYTSARGTVRRAIAPTRTACTIIDTRSILCIFGIVSVLMRRLLRVPVVPHRTNIAVRTIFIGFAILPSAMGPSLPELSEGGGGSSVAIAGTARNKAKNAH